jgi:flagellar P-ring protein precursor FlgI
MQIDVKVSSLGNAKNLQGGMLIATPLRPLTALPGDANSIYAIAQGAISTGGFAAGNNQSSAVKNHPTVALIPDGGIIERAAPNSFDVKPEINFLLRNPDFTTAMRVATAINASLGAEVATARNATVVAVKMPKEGAEDRVRFVAGIENLEVNPDTPARVVYNERTGTIVMGSNVRISTAIITHGNLSFELTKREESDLYVGQNLTGQVAIESTTKETELKVEEQTGEFRVLDQGVTIGEVARGLNALGVSARDIISILQALKECGALQAELVAM